MSWGLIHINSLRGLLFVSQERYSKEVLGYDVRSS